MKQIWRIAKTEMQNLFFSPVAWVVLAIYAIQTGMAFLEPFGQALRHQVLEWQLWNVTSQLFGGGVFASVKQHIFIYLPLITMGLMSRETSSGSVKLLYSSPVTSGQIIMGKFLSMMIFALVMIGILFIYIGFAAVTVGNLQLPLILSGLLGLFLLICTYSAIGLLISCLISYQIAVALSTFAVFTALNYVGSIGQDIPFIRDITYWLSLSGRADGFLRGLIGSADTVYFLLVITMTLMLAVIKLRMVKHSLTRMTGWLSVAGVMVIAVMFGYVTSRPVMKVYADTTINKSQTITPVSREIMSKLDGGLTITTYVNLLDPAFSMSFAAPNQVMNDMRRFEQYVRFKPEIKMEYVYYYDQAVNMPVSSVPLREQAEKAAEAKRLRFSRFKTPEQIRDIIDLSHEGNVLVRRITRGNGASTSLRFFNDIQKVATEREISAALQILTGDAPVVAFFGGSMRDIYGLENKDINHLVAEHWNRTSMVNLGYVVESWDGLSPLPEKTEILFIVDLEEPLSDRALKNVSDFVESGGNLFISSDLASREAMRPVAALVDVQLTDGILLQSSPEDPSLIKAYITLPAMTMFPQLERISGGTVTMPGTHALAYDTTRFRVTDVLMTMMMQTGTWNRLRPYNRMEREVKYEETAGDQRGRFPVAIALEREINGRQQRIFVGGDTDWLSNGELRTSRNEIAQQVNIGVWSEIISWLGYGKLPLDVNRPIAPDRNVNYEYVNLGTLKVVFYGIIPALLLVGGLVIWIVRKRR
ncbi:MAG: Gldg family protein [Rikenellaceae bacterium]|nr:Gldg family protein [Rikenellaceae bacterium]MCL2693204.1 Gldg family protein [Rikenellaceae bacterium]